MSLAATVLALRGDIYVALGLVLVAFVLDMLDGFCARYLKAESLVGRVADSIADVPLYLLFPYAVISSMYDGWMLVVMAGFVCAGIARLVRFTRRGFLTEGNTLAYEGVPVFMALPLVAVIIGADGSPMPFPAVGVALMFGMLSFGMLATFPFKKFSHPVFIGVLAAVCISAACILLWID